MSSEAIDAIRAVRIAAHDLENVCAAITGGVPMALSKSSIGDVGKSMRGITPRPLPPELGGEDDTQD